MKTDSLPQRRACRRLPAAAWRDLAGLLTMLGGAALGGRFEWNFDSLQPSSAVDTGDVVARAVSRGNNHGSTTLLSDATVSSGYPGASGGQNAAMAARTGPWDPADGGSAYLEFALTPAAGTYATLTALSFGSRSTDSGPRTLALYRGSDGFTEPVAPPIPVPSTGAWMRYERQLAAICHGETVFRIYGFDGTGVASPNIANWRLDDLVVVFEVQQGVYPPPDGLVSAQATASGFAASWNMAADAEGARLNLYTVEASGAWPDLQEAFVPVPGWQDAWVEGSTVVLDGLLPKTTYYWTVAAVGAAGQSDESARAEMTTLAPSAPAP